MPLQTMCKYVNELRDLDRQLSGIPCECVKFFDISSRMDRAVDSGHAARMRRGAASDSGQARSWGVPDNRGVRPGRDRSARALLGQLLESFVYQELCRLASWGDEPTAFFHFRDRDATEVDIVVERSGRALAGVEVKAAATVTAADFKGLRKLREIAGKRFAAGVVLYDGEATVPFGGRLFGVPIRALWEESA